jgi:hypothetical protein
MCTILPLAADYDQDGLQMVPRQANRDNGDQLPVCAYGAFFLRDLIWPPTADVPWMQYGHVMHANSYKYFFGLDFHTLRNKYNPTAYIPRARIPASHIKTQKGMSKRHKPEADAPGIAAIFQDLDFPVPQLPRDVGEDLPFDERLDFPPNLNEAFPVTITEHCNQFCCDILQKCGTVHFFIMHTLVMYKSHLVSSFGGSHRGMRVSARKIV